MCACTPGLRTPWCKDCRVQAPSEKPQSMSPFDLRAQKIDEQLNALEICVKTDNPDLKFFDQAMKSVRELLKLQTEAMKGKSNGS